MQVILPNHKVKYGLNLSLRVGAFLNYYDNEPRVHSSRGSIGRLTAKFKGEQFSGSPILDTEVTIDSGCICWITWADKEKFLQELNAVISKYEI